MADINPRISTLRLLWIFFAVIILCQRMKIVSVVAETDDDGDAGLASDTCQTDLSQFIPAPYGNNSQLKCNPIWNTFILRYYRSEDNVAMIVLSATYTTGWVGMGFSPRGMMIGSSAMIGWIGEDSQAIVKQFLLRDSTLSGVLPDAGNLALTHDQAVVVLHGSTIYLAFQLKLPYDKVQQSILLALGTRPFANNQLPEHDERTTLVFDFSAGTVYDTEKNIDTMKRNHKICSIFGWGILLPVGAIIARYCRHRDPLWYYLHTCIQSVGFIFALITMVTGHKICDVLQVDVGPHKGIGYLAFVLCLLQVMSIVARPSLESKVRMYWNWYHFLVGRTSLFLGSLNIVLGLQIGVVGTFWKIGYGILLAVMLVTVIVLEAFLLLRRHEQTLTPAFQVKPIY